MCKCLYCYKELGEGQKDFHPGCARKFFGTMDVPLLEYKHEELDQLAEQVIRSQTSLTGVQPKLSLNLSKHDGCSRLTIVGLWGDFIFKPQTESYQQLPENEDLTMHLAEAAKISVVPHSLIRLADGELGYITKRIDRTKNGEKIDMEDMCQLTLHPTEYKYKGSYEQIAKTIVQYSNTPKLDLTNYMQLLLFCFVTGNNDMHLKNFSLYRPTEAYQLTPAYDLINVAIANPKDKEEMALTLAEKKAKLRLADFLNVANTMGLEKNVVQRLIAGLHKTLPKWQQLIKDSFLSEEQKQAYEELMVDRLNRLKTEQAGKT
ncbi:MAG: HipA domain-containing protein [Prevotella sp.]|nr:HipA domain-containing protein [Prevotella sp.]